VEQSPIGRRRRRDEQACFVCSRCASRSAGRDHRLRRSHSDNRAAHERCGATDRRFCTADRRRYRKLNEGAANVPLWTVNSFIFAGVVTLARVFLCSLAGYALARVNFPGRGFIFLAVLATMMIPGVVLLIPKFIILKQLGLLATYPGGILPIVVDAFGIFLMKQFFEPIPGEVEEAARIDGATPFQIYWRVALPMATAPLIALSILAFQGTWNELQHFLIALGPTARDLWPLTLGLATLRGAGVGQQLDFGLFLAGSILMTLPMAIIFIIFQRYFVESSSHSAVKG
jgi:multiple sugar transport system permease protein